METYYNKAEADNLLANKVSNGSSASLSQVSLISDGVNNLPLVITRTGSSWFHGEYIATGTNGGCLFKYKTTLGEYGVDR